MGNRGLRFWFVGLSAAPLHSAGNPYLKSYVGVPQSRARSLSLSQSQPQLRLQSQWLCNDEPRLDGNA